MGVPVISLSGLAHVSRVGVSLLTNAGYPELIASTEEEYHRIARELAMDTPRLREMRTAIRERLRKSAIMNAPQFATDVEEAFRRMWRDWCRSASG
jgi:predicted O-linked N-acetylglucosamine transferase (SPINDLY family)